MSPRPPQNLIPRPGCAPILQAAALTGALILAPLLAPSPALGADDAPAMDLQDVPGPWENHLVALPGRGDDGADLTLHYLAAGPKDAPTVVLLHGFPDASFGWRHILPDLARDYRVLAPDMRGYAGSDVPTDLEGYALANLGGDILAFIDATAEAEGRASEAKVHLVTHDWGTSIGWEVATYHPERLLTFTAMDVPHPLTLDAFWKESAEQRKYKRFVGQMTFRGTPRILARQDVDGWRKIYEELLSTGTVTDEELAYYDAVYDDRIRNRGPLAYYRSLRKHKDEITERYRSAPKVAVPTLVLWGADDTYMLAEQAPRNCENVDARCEVEVFEDAHHQLPWDRPEAVIARWRAFVGEEMAAEGSEGDSDGGM